MPELATQSDVPLAPLTTLQLGGAAEHFLRVARRPQLIAALRWAKKRRIPVTLLGGGSNVIVPDAGLSGLTLQVAIRGVQRVRAGQFLRVTASAGEPWDELVASCVHQGLAGLECLSGIPGLVGATPIQNVGAYGQEVADTICAVEVLDRKSLEVKRLRPHQCRFTYRGSRFKDDPARFVVLSVEYELQAGGAPALRYAELQRALAHEAAPSLSLVRETVLKLRAAKSMLLDASDENHRSAGSFFTNPIVTRRKASAVAARAVARGLIATATEMPRFPQDDGHVKLAAGWLIERSGTRKGERHGPVGISTRHALCLVHNGGGSTRELLSLATLVASRVKDVFGVELAREPVLLGQ
jgi:UDP-N-acetylmuramate dehydrogenase